MEYVHGRPLRNARGVRTVPVTPGINIDMMPDGKVFGIEFLNAKEQLGAQLLGTQ